MLIPVVNPQQAGLPVASADMNACSAAARFLLNAPMAQAAAASPAQSLTGAALNQVNWAQPARDNDGTWQPGGASSFFTLNTQGFYEVAATIGIGPAAVTAECFVQVSTGPGNPAGFAVISTWWHGSGTRFTGDTFAIGSAGIIPVLLYAGDSLAFVVQPANTCTTGQFTGTASFGSWYHRMVST
jgi:hypothetical protein